MIYRIPLLLALLGAQLLLVALVLLGTSGDEEARPFLALDAEKITRITVSGAEGAAVELIRAESGWTLGDGLPADADKVQGVIDKLTQGQATWPVATSADSRERFEVTAESHQRRVSFAAGDEVLAEVYLGTSPGFRQVHARVEGDDDVYSIDFAVHELPVDDGDWLDRSLFRAEAVTQVTLSDGSVLRRTADPAGDVADADADQAPEPGPRWLLDGGPADDAAAEQLIGRIERLTVLGLYDGAGDALEAAGSIGVVGATGDYRLEFRHDADNDEYVLTSDRFGGEFTVAAYLVEQILLPGSDLLPVPETPEPEGSDAQSPGSPLSGPAANTPPG
jgi:hypothetical protein